jgi:uncharacterized protein YlaI
MVKCPKCKKEISSLTEERHQPSYYDVSLDKDGDLDYQFRDDGNGGTSQFFCPECDKFITEDEDEVKKILSKK